jgi:hypothetical protein
VRWTADPERFAVRMRLRIGGRAAKATRLRLRLTLRGRPLADDTFALDGALLDREVVLPRRVHRMRDVCWAPHHPT